MKYDLANITTFLKYNTVALIATLVDFTVLILFTDVFNFWYIFSAFWGAVSGGVVAFILGRNWAFVKKEDDLSIQAKKYIGVWVFSILFNVLGLYILVEFVELQYIISKIIVTITVGIGFNFLMQKYYIFR